MIQRRCASSRTQSKSAMWPITETWRRRRPWNGNGRREKSPNREVSPTQGNLCDIACCLIRAIHAKYLYLFWLLPSFLQPMYPTRDYLRPSPAQQTPPQPTHSSCVHHPILYSIHITSSCLFYCVCHPIYKIRGAADLCITHQHDLHTQNAHK